MAQSTHARTESKTVRPFSGLAQSEKILKRVALLADGEECLAAPMVQTFSESDLAGRSLEVSFNFDVDELGASADDANVPYVDTALIVMARARTHRVSKVLFQHPLTRDVLPPVVTINRASHPLIFGDKSGFDVRVALVLMHALQPEPLKPSMPGTWLAQRLFRLRPEQIHSAFAPQPLTEALRKDKGLPESCATYIEVDEASLLYAESLADAVVQYVDEQVLGFIQSDMRDPWSVQVQTQQATDLFVAITTAAHNVLSAGNTPITEEAIEACPGLSGFLEAVSDDLHVSAFDLVTLAGEDPSRLRAHFEALMNLNASTRRAFREE